MTPQENREADTQVHEIEDWLRSTKAADLPLAEKGLQILTSLARVRQRFEETRDRYLLNREIYQDEIPPELWLQHVETQAFNVDAGLEVVGLGIAWIFEMSRGDIAETVATFDFMRAQHQRDQERLQADIARAEDLTQKALTEARVIADLASDRRYYFILGVLSGALPVAVLAIVLVLTLR